MEDIYKDISSCDDAEYVNDAEESKVNEPRGSSSYSEASAFGDVSMRMEISVTGVKVVDLVAFGKRFQNVF